MKASFSPLSIQIWSLEEEFWSIYILKFGPFDFPLLDIEQKLW